MPLYFRIAVEHQPGRRFDLCYFLLCYRSVFAGIFKLNPGVGCFLFWGFLVCHVFLVQQLTQKLPQLHQEAPFQPFDSY